jgi:hypothetical protein
MNARTLLFRLLKDGLLDIRESSYQNNERVFFLSDMFHVLPSILEQVADRTEPYDLALQLFREWAETRGESYIKWLDQTIEQTKRQLAEQSDLYRNQDLNENNLL